MALSRLLPAARAKIGATLEGEKYRNVVLTSLTCAPVDFGSYFAFGRMIQQDRIFP